MLKKVINNRKKYHMKNLKRELQYDRISDRIKELREKKGMTQEYLAECTQMAPSSISRIETGARYITLEALVSVANALGVTANTLLYDNQCHDALAYHPELACLVADCAINEKRFLCEMVSSMKRNLRMNS